jgi:hypothetical protein
MELGGLERGPHFLGLRSGKPRRSIKKAMTAETINARPGRFDREQLDFATTTDHEGQAVDLWHVARARL